MCNPGEIKGRRKGIKAEKEGKQAGAGSVFLSWPHLLNRHCGYHNGSALRRTSSCLDCVTWPWQAMARHGSLSCQSASCVGALWSVTGGGRSNSGHALRQHSGLLKPWNWPGCWGRSGQPGVVWALGPIHSSKWSHLNLLSLLRNIW